MGQLCTNVAVRLTVLSVSRRQRTDCGSHAVICKLPPGAAAAVAAVTCANRALTTAATAVPTTRRRRPSLPPLLL